MTLPIAQPAFHVWAQSGFSAELVRLTPHDDRGTSAGKKPVLRDWQSRTVTPADIDEWAREGGNVGLRTRAFPAIDIDIDDPVIADVCERVATEVIGRTARRTRSNSARRALLYRLEGEPMHKTALRLTLPSGQLAKVEVLGDGQQLAVAGLHPSGVPNAWPDGQPVAARLAPLSLALRTQYLEALTVALRAAGCTVGDPPVVRTAPAPTPGAPAPGARTWQDDLPVTEEALRRLDPDCSYDDWVRVGMALHAKDSGTCGLNAWDSWSSRGDKYPGRQRLETKWATFRRGATSFGTLLSMAGVSGSVRALTGSRSRGPTVTEPQPDTEVWYPPAAGAESAREPEPEPDAPPDDAPIPGDAPPDGGDDDSIPESLEEVNRRYFLTEDGGKHMVCTERYNPTIGRSVLCRFQVAEFKTRYANAFIFRPGGEKPVNLAKAWLSWRDRRQYLDGVVFDPEKNHGPNVYNLWTGWPIQPAQGDWSVLRDHIYEVLCSGNDSWFAYVMGWLARLAQRPASPGEVALVFRGPQGSGKTVFGEAVRRMCGRHGLTVSSPGALTGRFSGHLEALILLVADEAVFAGDRAAKARLKSILTDPTILIEDKFLRAEARPNYMHVIMTTNSEWAVPAEQGDRRFAVFDTSAARVGDRGYFRRLHDSIRDPRTIAAMLHDLTHADLSGYEVRDIPDTDARQEQKEYTLEGPPAWLAHVLALESLGLPGGGAWQDVPAFEDLMRSYNNWAKDDRYRPGSSATWLGRWLAKLFVPTRAYFGGVRCRAWRIGSVCEAKKALCAHLGISEHVIFGAEMKDE